MTNNFQPNTKSVSIPALSSRILQLDLDGQPFNQTWEYRSIIGKLNFLEKSIRLRDAITNNITTATNQADEGV